MRLLILGGTRFLGRALAEAALAGTHEVTLFHRGKSGPNLFPEAEHLHGDRHGDLAALKGRRWDAVVDTCGYTPHVVQASAELLAGSAGHYTFISTISVYAEVTAPGVTEASPVTTMAPEELEEVRRDPSEERIRRYYGALKALCEEAAAAAMPDRALIIRPGLIVGPHDRSDRFPYWSWRVARGGEVLAPAPPDRPLQFIDVRDLAEWTLRMVEGRQTGVYNAGGADYTMMQLLQTCREVSGSDATFTLVPEAFLQKQQVGAWIELPLWIPGEGGLFGVSSAPAFAAGLRTRPLAEIVQDTLAWEAGQPAGRERRAGLRPEREAELLRIWHESRSGGTGR